MVSQIVFGEAEYIQEQANTINEMSDKIKNLELENETLRKRVSLMEWLLKSEGEKPSGKDNFERLDYNKFISPKIKD